MSERQGTVGPDDLRKLAERLKNFYGWDSEGDALTEISEAADAWEQDRQKIADASRRAGNLQAEIARKDLPIRLLIAEVRSLYHAEEEIRQAIGHTNWACLMNRCEEAKSALSPQPSEREEEK